MQIHDHGDVVYPKGYGGATPPTSITATRPNADIPVAPVELTRVFADAGQNVSVSWVGTARSPTPKTGTSHVVVANVVRQPAVTGHGWRF